MAAGHPLDRPVWNALISRQSTLAEGDHRARCFPPGYGPFAATATADPESLIALARLLDPGAEMWLVETDEAQPTPGTAVQRRADLVQMVAESVTPGTAAAAIEPLSEADADDMRSLALLTKPGPWSDHTHRLGDFVGIRDTGRLVAMAGERMKLDGFTEVSGVCTRPEHRGRGHAAALMRLVATRIIARGEQPFLHAYAANTGAIALYESLGFRTRRTMTLTVLTRA